MDNLESLVLEHLKAIRDDLRALTRRTGRLERAIAALRRDQIPGNEN